MNICRNMKMIQHIKNFKNLFELFLVFFFIYFFTFVKYLKFLTFWKYQISIEVYLGICFSLFIFNFLLIFVVDLWRQSRCILISSQEFCFLSTTIFQNLLCVFIWMWVIYFIFSLSLESPMAFWPQCCFSWFEQRNLLFFLKIKVLFFS